MEVRSQTLAPQVLKRPLAEDEIEILVCLASWRARDSDSRVVPDERLLAARASAGRMWRRDRAPMPCRRGRCETDCQTAEDTAEPGGAAARVALSRHHGQHQTGGSEDFGSFPESAEAPSRSGFPTVGMAQASRSTAAAEANSATLPAIPKRWTMARSRSPSGMRSNTGASDAAEDAANKNGSDLRVAARRARQSC